MSTVLVTGGAGFIGANLCLALKAAGPATDVVALDSLKRRGSELNLARLREVHERMKREAGDVESAARDDLEFHRAIASATQNDLYLLLLDSIGSTLIDIRRENLGSGSTPMTLGQHEQVLDRIAVRDSAGARAAMASHLEGVASWWRGHIAAGAASA